MQASTASALKDLVMTDMENKVLRADGRHFMPRLRPRPHADCPGYVQPATLRPHVHRVAAPGHVALPLRVQGPRGSPLSHHARCRPLRRRGPPRPRTSSPPLGTSATSPQNKARPCGARPRPRKARVRYACRRSWHRGGGARKELRAPLQAARQDFGPAVA